MRLAELCKGSKTCSTLIWRQLCLLNAQESQRSQVSVLISALDRVKQAFAQEMSHRQGGAGDFSGGQREADIFLYKRQSETGVILLLQYQPAIVLVNRRGEHGIDQSLQTDLRINPGFAQQGSRFA